MGTSCAFGIKDGSRCDAIYVHWDGMPDSIIPIIQRMFMDEGAIEAKVAAGACSSLDTDSAYNDRTPNFNSVREIEDQMEFGYLYDLASSQWLVHDSELEEGFRNWIPMEQHPEAPGRVRENRRRNSTRLSKRQLKKIIREEYSRLKNRGLI